MSWNNHLYSFTLNTAAAEIIDSFPRGRKSAMVSQAIWWWNNYSLEELLENNKALQDKITELSEELASINV